MNQAAGVLLALASLALSACGGGGGGDDHHPVQPVVPPPALIGFDVVDSYGVDSAAHVDPLLRLNPYEDSGQFEIYWDADNADDYTVQLRVNEGPYLAGSRLISEAWCGPGLDCDLQGVFFCDYYADFSFSCGQPGSEPIDWPITRVDDMVFELPQRLHLILDLCDLHSPACEYRTQAVWLE